MKDYHGILGVSKYADEKEIRKAYRRLALLFHPDRNKSREAGERFREINEAYAVLTGKEKAPETAGRGNAWDGAGMRAMETWEQRVARVWEEISLRRHDSAYR